MRLGGKRYVGARKMPCLRPNSALDAKKRMTCECKFQGLCLATPEAQRMLLRRRLGGVEFASKGAREPSSPGVAWVGGTSKGRVTMPVTRLTFICLEHHGPEDWLTSSGTAKSALCEVWY